MSSRAQSLNDENSVSPRLRKDQKEKIRVLVRTNSENPLISLGLVRDQLRNYGAMVRLNDDHTAIMVIMKDRDEKMGTEYEFPLMSPVRRDPPTLD